MRLLMRSARASRLFLVASNIPLIDAFQQMNPASAVSALWDTIEIRTALSPPLVFKTKELFDTGAPASPFQKFMKPTVVFSGAAGRQVVAPYGVAGDGTLIAVLGIAFVLGVGFLAGRASKR